MASTQLRTASVLAFERKLDPSDALFSAGLWTQRDESDSWPAVEVRTKSVRGTISNRLKTKDQDPAKLDASIQNPNLQTVDVAALPSDADTLRIRFSLRVLGGAGTPTACNNADYQYKLRATLDRYIGEHGFNAVATRYAHNLANGRFFWRNRVGAESVEVHIRQLECGEARQRWTFDALRLSLRDFGDDVAATDLKTLAGIIEAGLAGESFVLLEITAFVRLGHGQEVFPSQELILDQPNSRRGRKSKTLYTVNGVAAIHSQKIGNALRTIDTWYPGAAEIGPIAVEPYGSVTSQGKAYRVPKDKLDFYSLLDNWLLREKAPDLDQQHFVMANLIRGGVFGESEKD